MSALTQQQQEVLGRQLGAMRLTLAERLQAGAQDRQPVSLDQPIGRLTRMDAIQQQQMALGQHQRAERELQQVDAALRRLEQNLYGSCFRCQDSISYERLKIRPTTTFCYECQRELEPRVRHP